MLQHRHGEDPRFHKTLNEAVSNARVLAFVFVLLGVLFVLAGLASWRAWEGRVLAALAGTLLLGPGVLYWIAGRLLSRAKPAGAAIARKAAAAHVAAIVVFLVLGFAGLGHAFFAPAIAGLFFVPAVIAFLAETGRAMRAAVMLDDPAPAFQPVIPKPVLPVEEGEATRTSEVSRGEGHPDPIESERAAPHTPSSRGASATRDLRME
jgi:hypothetical protein